MLKTSEESREQSVQEAGAGQVYADALAILLERYYQANEASLRRLEEEILTHSESFIKQRVRAEVSLRDDFDDLCQEARIRIANGLRRKRESGKRIGSFPAWARIVISHAVVENKRKNTPQRIMTLKVRYIVMVSPRKDRFAFWQAAVLWLIGLRSQQGKPCVETERYRAFCQNDSLFVQHGLQGRDPTDADKVKLWELLEKFLTWIRTPLEQKQLVAHLLQLQPIIPLTTVPPPGGGEDFREPSTGFDIRETVLDWNLCWTEIRALKPRIRAALLLSLPRETLIQITAQPDPRPYLVSLLNEAVEEREAAKDMEAIWKKLPLPDGEIASLLKTDVRNIHTMRCRYRQHFERSVGRSIFL
jgi:hypothetical protein